MDLHEELEEITRENNQSETNYMNYYATPTNALAMHSNNEGGITLAKAVFEVHPPTNMRKSNFFHFSLSFYDEKNQIIEVEEGSFSGFPDEDAKIKNLRNGLLYQLTLRFQNGHSCVQEILITLIDSQTEEIIRYEGIDKNPDMRRVLLTHEKMCSRCQENKSCGNRNETPSDCVIVGKTKAKFFMKCNQNCLKAPGNPKEVRRFQLVVSKMSNMLQPLAKSNAIFVHNNSKNGRRPGSAASGRKSCIPTIKCLIPADGWVTGGSQIIVIGKNFDDGIQILLGNVLVWVVEVLSKNTLRFLLPPRNEPGAVEVFLSYKSKPIYQAPTVLFTYNALNEPSIEYEFQRLSKFIPRHPGDSDDISKVTVLKRTGDIMETLFNMQPVQIMVPTAPSMSKVCSNFHGFMTSNPSYHPCYLGSTEDCLRPNVFQSKQGLNTVYSQNLDDHASKSSMLFSKSGLTESVNFLQMQNNRNEACNNAMLQRAHGYNNGGNSAANSHNNESRCSTHGQHFCSDICTSINLYSTQSSFTNNCIYSATQRNDLELYNSSNNNQMYTEDMHRSPSSCINPSIKSRVNLSSNQSSKDIRTPIQSTPSSSSSYSNNNITTSNPPYCSESMYTNVLPYSREAHSVVNNIVYKSVLRSAHSKPSSSHCDEAIFKKIKLENKWKGSWSSSQLAGNNTPGITPMNTPGSWSRTPLAGNNTPGVTPMNTPILHSTPSFSSVVSPYPSTPQNSFMNGDAPATPSSYGGDVMTSYNNNCTPQSQQQQQCNRQLAYGIEKY